MANSGAPQPTGPDCDEALRHLLKQEKTIFDHATNGIMLTRNRCFERINKRAAAMFGYPPEELIGQPTVRLFASEEAYQKMATDAAKALSTQGRFHQECEMQHRLGYPLLIKLSAYVLTPNQPADGTIWIAEDITLQRATDLKLDNALRELYSILNTAVIGIALLRHRNIDRCNHRMEEIFGYEPGEMHGLSTRVWYESDEVWKQVGEDVYQDLLAGREAYRDIYFQRKDGSRFLGRLAGRAFDPEDPYAGSVWIIEDLTCETAEREELQLARKVFEVNSEAIMVTDANNRIVQVNAAFSSITGYDKEDILGQDPKILGSGRHNATFFHDMWSDLITEGHWSGEIWDRRKDGTEYPKWVRIDVIRDRDQEITHFVTVFSDISERKANEERIRHLAQHDALTGLPNRFTLSAHLEHALSRSSRNQAVLALMFIDLDNFKTINDTLGHHIGDRLLCEVADRIRKVVRKSDIVARIGGDEFVVVLEGIHHEADAAHVAQKIIDELSTALVIENMALHTTPSIGIALYPNDAANSDTLMRNADVAMYHAKSAGRNNYQFYAEHMNKAAAVRVQLEARLRAALQGDEFQLHYQPQVDLSTGKVIGVEALIRWYNTELGHVSPATFIPLSEEIGLIVPISEWVLRTACKTARQWLDAGVEFGTMSVNISPQQFKQSNFPNRLQQILDETGLPASRLELEITESTIMETAEIAIAMLCRLKDLGLSLAVDDFGTGYSSLAYLKRFPIDRLKIDRSFVMDIETDPADAAIARAIIALAHSLHLKVVAEGVETEPQGDFLKQQGCDFVQGYFYSRPIPAADAANYCQRRNTPLSS